MKKETDRLIYWVLVVVIGMGIARPVLSQPDASREVEVNWDSGTWTFDGGSSEEDVARLLFAGDWRPARAYRSLMEKEPAAMYGELLPLLRDSDLSFVNVETTIGTRGAPIPKGGPNFQSPPSAINALTVVPFDVALLANNHTGDYGPAALEETMHRLREAGLHTVGAGMSHEEASEPLILNKKGISIAIINCAEGEEGRSVGGGPGVYGLNIPAQKAQIRALRPLVDAIIVSFHGGREHAPMPPPYVSRALRAFAEAGADAVVAHHPHVPQGIEVVGGVPIVYSQGNFVFWQDEGYYRRVGYLVGLDVSQDGVQAMKITPYQQTRQGLQMLEEPHKGELLSDLKMLSGYLEENRVEAVWNAYIDRVGTGTAQLKELAEGIDEGSKRSAELLRNLFFTSAHRELFIDRMNRILAGEMGTSEKWAQDVVKQWLDRPVDDLLSDR